MGQVEAEYLPLYDSCGLGLTTWSPLSSRVLLGKYTKESIPTDSRLALSSYKVGGVFVDACMIGTLMNTHPVLR